MEKKINIAELLKDCPQGMELDCTIFENVTFEEIDGNNIVISRKSVDSKVYLTQYGELNSIDGKCVIFPKGKTTWEGFVPPCKFKDGDIIADSYYSCYTTICIFKGEGNIKGTVDFYCGIDAIGELFIKDVIDQDEHFGEINEYDFATEEEKQKLFDAIKENGYKWNADNKTLEKLIEPKFKVGDRVKHISAYTSGIVVKVDDKGYHIDYPKGEGVCYINFTLEKDYELAPNKFDITTLKTFDKVLVRDKDTDTWEAHLFSRYYRNSDRPYICIGCEGINEYKQCIPYDSNKELLSTTNDCDEFYKTW